MEQIRLAYSKTPTLKSRPKDQRSIIADVLLHADRPLSFAEIVTEAKKANYETKVPIEESILWHLDRMLQSRSVKVQSK